jgi:hypothetical protein
LYDRNALFSVQTEVLIEHAALLSRRKEVLIRAGDLASSKPERPRNQSQPRPDSNNSNRARDARAGRRETFGGDGCHHDRHRAEVHDPDD